MTVWRDAARRSFLLAICVFFVACADDKPPPGSIAGTLVVHGVTRTYRFYLPPAPASAKSIPIVVMLHGGAGDGLGAERFYGWDEAARRGGFMMVYPDGIDGAWNAGTCCGPQMVNHLDDVGFLSDLIGTFVRDGRADPRRVFVAGISNGGFMAYRMACEATVPIAAIGAVAGSLMMACPHPRAVSLIAIHGLADRNVPFAGGPGAGKIGYVRPVASSVAVWTARDRCGRPTTYQTAATTVDRWSCAERREVQLITIAGQGHGWPPDATAALADFFVKARSR